MSNEVEPLGTRLRREAIKHAQAQKDNRDEACVQKLVNRITARAKEFPDRTEFVLTAEEAKSCGNIANVVDRLARERIFCMPEPCTTQGGLPAMLGSYTIYLGELPEDVANGSLGIALLRAARGEVGDGAGRPDLRHLADGAGLSDRRLDEVTGRPVSTGDGFTDTDRLNWLEGSTRSLTHTEARAFVSGLADRARDIGTLRDAMDHFMRGSRYVKVGA